MAPRAYWKGYLKLSLVSCPIALFPASSEREKISFHQLNKKTGHYPYEVRNEADYFDDIPDEKIPKDMLDLASHIVKTKEGHFEPSNFEDRYEDALKELLRKKQEGKPIEQPERPKPTNVVNLMDALRRSVEASGKAKEPARRAAHEKAEQSKRKKARR